MWNQEYYSYVRGNYSLNNVHFFPHLVGISVVEEDSPPQEAAAPVQVGEGVTLQYTKDEPSAGGDARGEEIAESLNDLMAKMKSLWDGCLPVGYRKRGPKTLWNFPSKERNFNGFSRKEVLWRTRREFTFQRQLSAERSWAHGIIGNGRRDKCNYFFLRTYRVE